MALHEKTVRFGRFFRGCLAAQTHDTRDFQRKYRGVIGLGRRVCAQKLASSIDHVIEAAIKKTLSRTQP